MANRDRDTKALDSRREKTMIGLLALIARGIKDQTAQVVALDKLGVAQADIASLLGMNPTTVRTTLHRKRGKTSKAMSKARAKK